MGAKHSLEDDLITFKLTSKQFGRSGENSFHSPNVEVVPSKFHIWLDQHIICAAKKCDKNQVLQKEKLKKAIEQVRMLDLLDHHSDNERAATKIVIYSTPFISNARKKISFPCCFYRFRVYTLLNLLGCNILINRVTWREQEFTRRTLLERRTSL